MSRFLLAHDLGTSAHKATLFAEDGTLVGSSSLPIRTHYFAGGRAEQNAEDWWTALCRTTRDLLAKTSVDPRDIAAVGLCGHMMGCLCLDAAGKPLRPHVLWADLRAQRQNQQLIDSLGQRRIYQLTGHRCSSAYGLQKLMWIRDHEPEVFARTATAVNAKDWLCFRLTGKIATEHSDAAGFGCLDLQRLDWSDTILEAVRIPRDRLPPVYASTDRAGTVHADAAAATGLLTGTPVVFGAGDGVSATVGAGCIDEGPAYCVIGSSAWVSFVTNQPLLDQDIRTVTWPHMVAGKFIPCGTSQSVGACWSWARRELLGDSRQQNADQSDSARQNDSDDHQAYARMMELAAASPVGSRGVRFLPYLMGERTPYWNPAATGAFLGLRLESKREDLLRSVLEGTAVALGQVIDVYRQNHYPMSEVRLIGGGARNDLWCQIMADVWNARVSRLQVLDGATSMGAAVAAGVGVGVYSDFTAIERFIRINRIFTPDPQTVAEYQPVRKAVTEAWQALEPLFPSLAVDLGTHQGE